MSKIVIRKPESIYKTEGVIENGTFLGRWHFSFGEYHNPEHTHFGTLRVLNDDTLSPGSVWPLHPHHDIEVVTYCADGEFRHADEHGVGGVLKKGWVQHTTVGRGMMHSEINNCPDKSMRFIQMWFLPSEHDLEPSVEQKAVDSAERKNMLLPLVSKRHPDALSISSDAEVFSSFLQKGRSVRHRIENGRGAYLYVLEGGTVEVNSYMVEALGAVEATGESELHVTAVEDAELLLVNVSLV
jgi:redox-sensitive bicupin YhaK (pirin superfamily)